MIPIGLGFGVAVTFHMVSFWMRSRSLGLRIDKFVFFSLGLHSVLLACCFIVVVTLASFFKEGSLLFASSFFFFYFVFMLLGAYQLVKLDSTFNEKAI